MRVTWVLASALFVACGSAKPENTTPAGAPDPGAEDTTGAQDPGEQDSASAGTGGRPMVAAGSSEADSVSDGAAPLDAGADIGTKEASAQGTSPGPISIASAIDHFRWEFPCLGSAFVTDGACSYDLAKWKSAGGTVDQSIGIKAELARTFGGAPTAVYAVTLRFRGVAEGNEYKFDNGLLDDQMTAAPHFHVGGTVAEHFQIYSLAISAPQQIYYLNAFPKLVSTLAVIDYTVTIQVRGGATVTFGMGDTNTACFSNHEKLVVPGVPPAPEPFNGQFIQVDVVSVAPAP
jgi:hypothetical protein